MYSFYIVLLFAISLGVVSASEEEEKSSRRRFLPLLKLANNLSDQSRRKTPPLPPLLERAGQRTALPSPSGGSDMVFRGDQARYVVTVDAAGARCAVPADFDGDGDLDLVSVSSDDSTVAWYERLSDGNYTSKKMISTASKGARIVTVGDMDQDNLTDVVVASFYDHTIGWFRNLGEPTDGRLFGDLRVISRSAISAQGVSVADLDNDGDLDVLCASSGDNTIAWYENLGVDGKFCEVKNVVDANSIGIRTVIAADLNEDGYLDLVAASKDDGTIAWYRNDKATTFEKIVIDSEADGAYSLVVRDVDNDTHLDVVIAANKEGHNADNGEGGKVSFYRNGWGSGGQLCNFTKVAVTAGNISGENDFDWFVLSVWAGDLDMDGDVDIASASFGLVHRGGISWYENVDGNGAKWSRHKIYVTPSMKTGHYVFGADMDGDGDTDLVATTHADNTIQILTAITRCDDSRVLPRRECCTKNQYWNGSSCVRCAMGAYPSGSKCTLCSKECPRRGLAFHPTSCPSVKGCGDVVSTASRCDCGRNRYLNRLTDTCESCPDGHSTFGDRTRSIADHIMVQRASPEGTTYSISDFSWNGFTASRCEWHQSCQDWRTYSQPGTSQCIPCTIDSSAASSGQCDKYFSLMALLCITFLLLCYSFPSACGMPIPLRDVSVENNRLIVTTAASHCIPGWGLIPVQLYGTGDSRLDNPSNQFCAHRLDRKRFSLHRVERLPRKRKPSLRHQTTTFDRQYSEWAAYITEAEIGWVKVRYLQELADTGQLIPRRQDVPANQIEVGCYGSFVDDCEKVTRWVLSHPWCSTRHPDPEGRQLKWIVRELDRLGAQESDLVFYDFMSIYQHDFSDEELWAIFCERFAQKQHGVPEEELPEWPKPGTHPAVRNESEQALFEMGLSRSDLLYSFYGSKVIIAPEPPCTGEPERDVIPGYPAYTRLYMHRGWCFLEISLSKLFKTIANSDDDLVKNLCKKLPGNPVEFEHKFFKSVRFSFAGDADVVCEMFSRLYYASPEGAAARQLFSGFETIEPMYASDGSIRILFPYTLVSTIFRIVPVLAHIVFSSIVAFCLSWYGRVSEIRIIGMVTLNMIFASTLHALKHRRGYRRNPVTKRRERFRQIIQQQHRKPYGYSPGSGRSVSAGAVWDVHAFFEYFIARRDCHYVFDCIVKPLTVRRRLSYAELVGPPVEAYFWYTTYFRGQMFSDFVHSVTKHAKTVAVGGFAWRRVRYWVEDLSTNPWTKGGIESDYVGSSSVMVLTSLAHCRGTVIIMDDKVLPLSSARCCFEIVKSLEFQAEANRTDATVKTPMSIGTTSWTNQTRFRVLFCTPLGLLNHAGPACSILWPLAQAVDGLHEDLCDDDDSGCKQHVMEKLDLLSETVWLLVIKASKSLMNKAQLHQRSPSFGEESEARSGSARLRDLILSSTSTSQLQSSEHNRPMLPPQVLGNSVSLELCDRTYKECL